jgi:predicted RNase H-like HicB family nuclease
MRYPAYLEVGPDRSTLALVFALPGVGARGRTPEAALAALPAAITAELARLTGVGRALPAGADGAIEIAESERVAVPVDVAGGATCALFRYELRPTRPEDAVLALDRVALAHAEIGRAASAGMDDPLAAALLALAEREWWLLSRLGNRPPAQLPPETDPLARSEAVHMLVIDRFANLLPGDIERHAVFNGEPWTTRKVLRRLACAARDAAASVLALADAPQSTPRAPR